MKKLLLVLAVGAANMLYSQVFFENFTAPQAWTTIDGDGDGSNWSFAVPSSTTTAWPAGNKTAISYSFDLNLGPVLPENILVSPSINLSSVSSPITFSWDSGTTESTAGMSYQEYYSVYVVSGVSVGSIDPSFLDAQTPIFSDMLTSGNSVIFQSFDISSFAGQSDVKLIFRHHNCTEEWNLLIDNVSVEGTVTLTDNDSDTYMSDVDCDDNNPNIYPGATEVCDLVDNDCDGQTDEGLATTTYYLDTDMDTYGTGTGVAYCANPGAGFATVSGDCNDNNAAIHPGATDIPNNGIDEDCVGGDATSTSTVVAVSDNGTCTENDVDGFIAILANDLVNGAAATISNAEVDIDLVTNGFQNTFTSVTPSVVWTYDGQFFGTLACNPALNVEGTVTLDYRICEKNNLTNCSGTATVTVVIAPSTVSLDEQTIVFALFPNPTKDLLTISSANKVKAVSVIGLDGKVVLNATETTINVASLTNGLYHIELMFDNGTIGRSTFMKN